MSTDLVLDLDADDPDPGGDPVWWRTAYVPVWVAALLVLAVAVLSVAATRTWDAQQARAARPKTVAVLVNIPADNGLIGSRDGTTLTLGSALQVINTGPRSITLGPVASTTAGVTLRGDGNGRAIPPGTAGRVILRGSIDCRNWLPTKPIEMRLDLTDADGVPRPTIKTVVTQGAWDGLLSTC